MSFDLYVWKTPRDIDADGAAALVERWQAAGGDPAASPFESTTDIGWFHRELMPGSPGARHVVRCRAQRQQDPGLVVRE